MVKKPWQQEFEGADHIPATGDRMILSSLSFLWNDVLTGKVGLPTSTNLI